MKKGDIVLIPFPFTDLSANKNWPAIILIDSQDDVTVCFITTQLKWQSDYDIPIQPTEFNGLRKPSLIRISKFAAIDKDLIIGRLGTLDHQYSQLLNNNLISLLKLNIWNWQDFLNFQTFDNLIIACAWRGEEEEKGREGERVPHLRISALGVRCSVFSLNFNIFTNNCCQAFFTSFHVSLSVLFTENNIRKHSGEYCCRPVSVSIHLLCFMQRNDLHNQDKIAELIIFEECLMLIEWKLQKKNI